MLQKHKILNLTYIIDANGQVITDEADMDTIEVKFFQKQLQMEETVDPYYFLSHIPKLITTEDNEMLMCIPTLQ